MGGVNQWNLRWNMLSYLGFDPDKNTCHTIADYLKEFETLDLLSLQLKRQCYDSKESLVAAFLQNNVVFHKSCISAYIKQKLNRKWKFMESWEG